MGSRQHIWTMAMPLASCSVLDAQVMGSAEFKFPAGNVYSGGSAVAVELWIAFEKSPTVHAWSHWHGDVVGADPLATWGNLHSPYLAGPSGTVGTPSAGTVTGILLHQIHFPPTGLFANTDNPIMIWSGEWSTSDLTPRTVNIGTMTYTASVYIFNGDAVPLKVQEGVAEIQVIPSPVSLVPLVLATFATRQRRRPKLA